LPAEERKRIPEKRDPSRRRAENVADCASTAVLVALNEEFEEGLLVLTHWALFWRFFALVDVAAVATLPLDDGGPLEHLARFEVAEKLQISALVMCFDGRHTTEQAGYVFEAFFLGDLPKARI
jgi:hypothetical protein